MKNDKVYQADWIAKWSAISPDKICLEEQDSGRTSSYRELNAKANALVCFLEKEYGLQESSKIAVLSDFCIEYVALFSATQKKAYTLVPLNFRLAAPEISHILKETQVDLIVYDSKYQALITDFNTYKTLNIFDLIKLENDDSNSVISSQIEDDHPLFILYTAGTTGLPKGVLYTHKMLFWNSINTSLALIINSESRTINVMPPFHTGGWNVLLTPILHHGGFVMLCKKFDPLLVLNTLQNENITLFMGVPTMLQMIAEQEKFEKSNFPSLMYIIAGGEPMPIPLIEKWEKVGVAIRQGYGMTEVGPNLTSLHQSDAIRKKGSIGRTNFYVNARVVDEFGNDVASNESGELWLNGPMTTPGYFNNKEASGMAFSIDGQWFKTGDLVRRDSEGYIFVVDRIKNMYISGGENVYPAEVERILIALQEVEECAVIPVKHEKWGETGKAIIVFVKNLQISQEEIIQHCAIHLAKYKVPKSIEIVDSIPKSETGKIDRNKLKRLFG